MKKCNGNASIVLLLLTTYINQFMVNKRIGGFCRAPIVSLVCSYKCSYRWEYLWNMAKKISSRIWFLLWVYDKWHKICVLGLVIFRSIFFLPYRICISILWKWRFCFCSAATRWRFELKHWIFVFIQHQGLWKRSWSIFVGFESGNDGHKTRRNRIVLLHLDFSTA